MSYPMSFIISKRKETIVKRLTAAIILGLVSLFIAPDPAVAQSPETTASEVVDQETLKAFVEEAKAWSETITNPNDVAPYTVTISVEGDWKHGNTYLILMLPNGTVFFHAGDASANGKNLYDIEDSHGNKVVQATARTCTTSKTATGIRWCKTSSQPRARAAVLSSITGTIRPWKATKTPPRPPTPPAMSPE